MLPSPMTVSLGSCSRAACARLPFRVPFRVPLWLRSRALYDSVAGVSSIETVLAIVILVSASPPVSFSLGFRV